uniref:Protein E6 n=1 Tax=Rousettus bat papillomavirus TaxID=3141903 RepID=A0AAU7E3L0_9PAPI
MELPKTIKELCELLETPAGSIEICCHWCRKPLDNQDKYKFCIRDFRLVYEDGKPFASCSRCTRAAARHERENAQIQVPLLLEDIVLLEGVGLDRICIRCTICLKPLGEAEKDAFQAGGFYALAIGKHTYRAVCRMCMVPDGAP